MVATPTHEGSAIVFLLSPEDFSYITWRTVWMCVQCGCVYSVDVCTVWMCVQCGCVYSVDVCTVWMCVLCRCVYCVHDMIVSYTIQNRLHPATPGYIMQSCTVCTYTDICKSLNLHILLDNPNLIKFAINYT